MQHDNSPQAQARHIAADAALDHIDAAAGALAAARRNLSISEPFRPPARAEQEIFRAHYEIRQAIVMMSAIDDDMTPAAASALARSHVGAGRERAARDRAGADERARLKQLDTTANTTDTLLARTGGLELHRFALNQAAAPVLLLERHGERLTIGTLEDAGALAAALTRAIDTEERAS